MPARISEEIERELATLYEDHTSLRSLSQATGVSVPVCQRAVAKFGTIRKNKRDWHVTKEFADLNDESAYWLGFVAADGHIRVDPEHHRRSLTIEVNRRDEDHIEKLRTFLGFGTVGHRTRDDCVYFVFSSKSLVENITEWIPSGNKTELDNFSIIPEDHKKNFVRGYFDGDGSMGKSRFGLTSCPETLVPVADYISKTIDKPYRIYSKAGTKAKQVWFTGKATKIRFIEEFAGYPALDRKWSNT